MFVAYFAHMLADPALAATVRETPPGLQRLLCDMLGQGRELGQVGPEVDIPAEVAFLLAGAEGLQAGVLLGQHTPERAVALIDHQLGRIFR